MEEVLRNSSSNEIGRMSLPFVGDVQAGGSTLEGFSNVATLALANEYRKPFD